MLDSLVVVPIAACLSILSVACVVLLPRSALVVVLILIRTVADIGGEFSATGPLLPGTAINALVALAAICAVFVPAGGSVSPNARAAIFIVVAAITLWALIAVLHFGLRGDFFGEFFRIASLVAVLILAYRIGTNDETNVPRCLNWVVGPPALILIVGYIIGWGPTILEPAHRAAGTFSHPNSAAAFFAVGSIACIWGYGRSRTKSSLGVAIMAVIALLLTQSLGGVAAFGLGAVTFFVLNARLSLARRVLVLTTALGVGAALFVFVGPYGRLSEIEGFSYGDAADSNSADWRIVNWQSLIPIWWDEAPFLGFGLGSTRYEIQPLGTYPHSIFVQILVEMGLVGALVTMAIAARFVAVVRGRRQTDPAIAAALAAITITIAVHGIAANWLNYSPAQYLAVFIIGAMLGRTKSETSSGRKHRRLPPGYVAPQDRPTGVVEHSNP